MSDQPSAQPAQSTLGAVTTAMITPFTPTGALDLDGAVAVAEHLVGSQTSTVLLGGTTGESPTLSADELFEMFTAVEEAVGDRCKIMIGTGTNDTKKSVALTEKATQCGADAILAVTPYYNKPTQRMLVDHFTQMAAATDKPVVLYDIPGRTSRAIELPTLLKLAEVDNIVGVKDAKGNLQEAAELLAQTGGAFEVYSGADELNLPYLSIGASGFVSVASHLAGNELADMARVFASDPVKACEIHQRLLPLFRAIFIESSPAPVKGAMQRLGLPAGPVRGPLLDAEKATVDAVMAALDHAGISAP